MVHGRYTGGIAMTSCAIESVNFTDCQFFVIVHYCFTTSCTDVETKQQ